MFCKAANCRIGTNFRSWLLSYTLLTFLLLAPNLSAEVQKVQESTPVGNSPVGADQLANVTLGLIVILGLIFALAWLFRRYGNLPTFNRSNIQIIGGVSLGPREKAILLEVEGERLLIGVAHGQVTKLHTLPGKTNTEQDDSQTDEAFAMTLQQEKNKNEEVTS